MTYAGGEVRARPPAPEEVRSARLLLGVTLTTGVVLGLMGVVLLQLFVALLNQTAPSVEFERRGPVCTEGSTQDCEAGEVCRRGQCVKARRPKDCQVGDPCGIEGATCTCAAPLTCERSLCQAPEQVAAACDDPDVQRVLRGVAEICKNDWESCPAEDLERLALSSKDFDGVLAKFPNTISVHFPGNKPSIQRGGARWPVDLERAFYRSQFGKDVVAEALRDAQEIIIIGRSSEGGKEDDNFRYSRLRANAVLDMLRENARSPEEARDLGRKVKRLLLGSRKVLELEFFRDHYANRMIAWSEDEQATLRANIADDRLRGKERSETRRIANQVVFVVPVPCRLPGA